MYKVGIIGAGIGGSYLSYMLSKKGIDNIIFDFRASSEKLCAGGVSFKTIAKFPALKELPCTRKSVLKTCFITPKDRILTINLEKPLTIFHRKDLDQSVLNKAQALGSQLIKEKVQNFIREGNHWVISTKKGDYNSEILVGADGALSKTRNKLGLQFNMERDFFFGLEGFLDVQEDVLTVKFFPDLKGYLWAFPRTKDLAVGIVSKGSGKKIFKDLKKRLLKFAKKHYPVKKTPPLRGAYIPVFNPKIIQSRNFCPQNIALIGDASSFVDPISGEGIYYSIYSAHILASCIKDNRLHLYWQSCMDKFGKNLIKSSHYFEQFYHPEFIDTLAAMAKSSKSAQRIMSRMITGDINYLSLKGELKSYFFTILTDCIFRSDIACKKELAVNLGSLQINRLISHLRHKIS